MKTILSSRWPDVLQPFRIHSHGRVQVHEGTLSFGFQIRAKDSVPHPTMIFGLAQAKGAEPQTRFVVRLDLDSGEVWDCAHETGLLGRLESVPPALRGESHPLVLRWEIEHKGYALIPRLHIGEEEFLYPAQLAPAHATFMAFSGHDLEACSQRDVFSPGYVWCQDRIQPDSV